MNASESAQPYQRYDVLCTWNGALSIFVWKKRNKISGQSYPSETVDHKKRTEIAQSINLMAWNAQ